MFRKFILTLAASLIAGSALAQSGTPQQAPRPAATVEKPVAAPTPDQARMGWVRRLKACLIEHKVEVSGNHPDCYLSGEYRLMCRNSRLGAIAQDCNRQASQVVESDRIKW